MYTAGRSGEEGEGGDEARGRRAGSRRSTDPSSGCRPPCGRTSRPSHRQAPLPPPPHPRPQLQLPSPPDPDPTTPALSLLFLPLSHTMGCHIPKKSTRVRTHTAPGRLNCPRKRVPLQTPSPRSRPFYRPCSTAAVHTRSATFSTACIGRGRPIRDWIRALPLREAETGVVVLEVLEVGVLVARRRPGESGRARARAEGEGVRC